MNRPAQFAGKEHAAVPQPSSNQGQQAGTGTLWKSADAAMPSRQDFKLDKFTPRD